MGVADHKAKQGRFGLSVLDLLPHNITIVIITITIPTTFVIIVNLIIIAIITVARIPPPEKPKALKFLGC